MKYLKEFGIKHVALDIINQDHEEAAYFIVTISTAIQQAELNTYKKEAVLPLLQALLTHKTEHFEREESLMLAAQFPALPNHKQEHSRLTNELKALIDHWIRYQDIKSLRAYMHQIFPLWLKSHAATMDHASAEYITSH